MLQSADCRSGAAYVAAQGFLAELLEELRRRNENVLAVREDLVLVESVCDATPPAWAQNVWHEPVFIPVTSIADAAAKLKSVQRNWHFHSTGCHRRGTLIAEKLPHVSAKPLVYGSFPPAAPLGSWTLWDEHCLLASARCSSPFPGGQLVFAENKVDPPSRAYLKLWEVFTRCGIAPQAGELCVDLGACPGGWTWVAAEHGARVFSLDKSPLDAQVERHPLVNACLGSGFGLDPRHVGRVDWLLSDMICYPDRLWNLVERWLAVGAFRRAVCTLKFQRATDHDTAALFAAVPGSRLMHLSVNKHELTWIKFDEADTLPSCL